MYIGRAIDGNVPNLEQKRPRFRANALKCPTFRLELVKCKDENVLDSDQQGTKTSQIPISKVRKRPKFLSARYENVPDFDQKGRKRPRFRYNMLGFNAIKCDFWENMRKSAIRTKICGIMRRMEKYAELCGGQENVRYRTHRT